MTPVNIGKWADADPLPSGSILRSDGFIGAFVYGGTPGREKSTSSAQRINLMSARLQIVAIYENLATDINGGSATGSAHADALMADLRNCGYPNTTPVGVAADEHLTAAQINLGVQYQKGFYQRVKSQGWLGLTGGYGFKEYTQAIHSAGMAEWIWQCGSVNDLWSGVTFWQDNTTSGPIDSDWQLLTLGEEMPLTQADVDLIFNNKVNRQALSGDTEAGYTSLANFLAYSDSFFALVHMQMLAQQGIAVTPAQMTDLETKLAAALPKGWNVAITPSS